MKKVFVWVGMLLCSLLFQVNVNASELDNQQTNVEVLVENLDTGEFMDVEYNVLSLVTIKNFEVNTMSQSFLDDNSGNYTTTAEIEVDLIGSSTIGPLTSRDTETNPTGVVKTFVSINYDKYNGNIRVNSASTRWTPTSSYAIVSNRDLKVQQAYSIMQKFPASNSYATFYTGWGYEADMGSHLTAKATASATVTMSGMSSQRVSATVLRN